MRINGKIIERPKTSFMRVSLGIHEDDIREVIETYELMSKKYFTHAKNLLYSTQEQIDLNYHHVSFFQ